MRTITGVIVLSLSALLGAVPCAQAEVPRLLAWQGVALDSLDQPLDSGAYLFSFSIWTADGGGDSLWGESQVVSVENGVLNVLLGGSNPIPVSAFDDVNRYLQVQFESEEPYVPRTRIVSVGYSYRVGTIHGASGGVVTSDIQLHAFGAAPSLRLVTTGPQVAEIATVAGLPDGGGLLLADEAGTPTLQLYPDEDGSGGGLVLFTDFASGHGLAIDNASGSGSPYLLMVGDSSLVEFSMGHPGDASVNLGWDAVSNYEILDEPGISAAAPRSVSGVGQTDSILNAVTINYPAEGYAVIVCEATFNNDTEANYLYASLYRDSSLWDAWFWDGGDADGFYDLRQTYTYTESVTPGTFTYHFRVQVQTAGSVDVSDAKITIMYFPTTYGTVGTMARRTPDLAGMSAGRQVMPAPSPLDMAGERTASVAWNAARIERELNDMKARMAQLEARLRSQGPARDQDSPK